MFLYGYEFTGFNYEKFPRVFVARGIVGSNFRMQWKHTQFLESAQVDTTRAHLSGALAQRRQLLLQGTRAFHHGGTA